MKTVGIIGGMGPASTIDLFQKIVANTPAHCDQEHIHLYIDNNTSIPHRSEAILRGGTSPISELIRSAKTLEKMGADFLVIACNTAHYYYKEILPHIHIPIVNMIAETAEEIQLRNLHTIGLLATDGTVQAKVYDDILSEYGIQIILPNSQGQEEIMRLIYEGVKAKSCGWDIHPVLDVMSSMQELGAEAFILGCTELPVAFHQQDIPFSLIDPSEILAKRTVIYASEDIPISI